MNCGSSLSLNVSTRWGLSPRAFQIRPTVDFDSPLRSAIDLRDHLDAALGWLSSVSTSTCSIRSSVIVRGAPGRGSSVKPSNRSLTNRARHLHTVCGHTPTSAATSLLDLPVAQHNTIRDRCASACEDFGRRAQRSNVCRSSSVNVNSATGRPLLATNKAYIYSFNFWRRTLAQLMPVLRAVAQDRNGHELVRTYPAETGLHGRALLRLCRTGPHPVPSRWRDRIALRRCRLGRFSRPRGGWCRGAPG